MTIFKGTIKLSASVYKTSSTYKTKLPWNKKKYPNNKNKWFSLIPKKQLKIKQKGHWLSQVFVSSDGPRVPSFLSDTENILACLPVCKKSTAFQRCWSMIKWWSRAIIYHDMYRCWLWCYWRRRGRGLLNFKSSHFSQSPPPFHSRPLWILSGW